MSFGFYAHARFRVAGAVDAQNGKPSSGKGTLQCNLTYAANLGIRPLELDLSTINPKALRKSLNATLGDSSPTVLISCAPCTGFTRTLPNNHLQDDERNSLVVRSSLFVAELRPDIFLMENARELIVGNFKHHHAALIGGLTNLGYQVHSSTHMLSRFGLPQTRERALIIAVRQGLELRTLDDLWDGYRVVEQATHVRRAIASLPSVDPGEAHPDDPFHVSPSFNENCIKRLRLVPKDGGSWSDLRNHPNAETLLTPAMLRYIARGKFGSHPDVYGRLWWDRPAVTVKRECAHTGNGRYAHPDQDRLCTVREMAILQGFPRAFRFSATGISNMYRHIGDAVPPLISFQLARLCEWILGGRKPSIRSVVLPNTSLTSDDIVPVPKRMKQLELPLQAVTLGNRPRPVKNA